MLSCRFTSLHGQPYVFVGLVGAAVAKQIAGEVEEDLGPGQLHLDYR